MIQKDKPIAEVKWDIPESIRGIDGLDISEAPHLIAFSHGNKFYTVRSKNWTLLETYNLMLDLGPEAEELWKRFVKCVPSNYVS